MVEFLLNERVDHEDGNFANFAGPQVIEISFVERLRTLKQ